MFIWRVEDGLSRQGPYRSSDPHVEEARDQLEIGRTPPPFDDWSLYPLWRKLKNTSEWRFGFISLAQFNNWFHTASIRRELTQGGMKLCKYSVPPEQVHVGDTQLCFRCNSSTLMETLNPNYAD